MISDDWRKSNKHKSVSKQGPGSQTLFIGSFLLLLALLLSGCELQQQQTSPPAAAIESPATATSAPVEAEVSEPEAETDVETDADEAEESSNRINTAPAAGFTPEENPGNPDSAIEVDLYAASAPEFPTDMEWLNTDRPLSMAELRGKIVLLDFWTYGCINCQHNFPDLKRLEEEYPDELVVIGIHSAKFDNEKESDNIRQTILRYELEHPVINDRDLSIWHDWGVEAWPTLILIDPVGVIYGIHIGERVYPTLKPEIQSLVRAYDLSGRLDRTPLNLKLEREGLPETVLSFPSKVLADEAGGRLFIADTNHHRLVISDLDSGDVLGVIGQGPRGFEDGAYQEATFSQPQGMALSADGQTLYVADTANHAIRQVDLAAQTVTTLAGNGLQNRDLPPSGGLAPDVDLSSPWDVLLQDDQLYVAMTGLHQIWRMDLSTQEINPLIGNAFEERTDGPFAEAELAQPSALTFDGQGRLVFADAESSAIRLAEVAQANGEVTTLAGGGHSLFDFGDIDGPGPDARLQHPLGLTFYNDTLYVADTYNSKIKQVDPQTGETRTLFGAEHGWRDGADPRFFEPSGLDAAGDKLYVADTNNHVIRIIDLDSNETQTLVLKGIEQFSPTADEDTFRGKTVELDPVQIGTGNGEVVLNVHLPAGYKVNGEAPYSMNWRVSGDVAVLAPDANRSIVAPQFPLNIAATFQTGQGQLTSDLAIFYCEADKESLCLIEQVRLIAPVEVVDGAAPTLNLDYEIPLPDIVPSS